MRAYAIIPSYNPGEALVGVAERVEAELGREAVLIVDDGSADGSGDLAESRGYTVIRHLQNQGKGVALQTGFDAALERGAEWVLTLDADGQHDPGEIPKFLAEAESGRCQILIGTRMGDTRDMPFQRIFANRLTSAIISALAGQRIEDSQSGYRCIDARVLRAVRTEFRRYDAESEIVVKASRAGFAIGSVPIKTIYGEEESKINPFVDSMRFARVIWRLLRVR
jgi:glycosyltransferase involved in cell wall biosynthesis